MYRTILVPLDGSTLAERALPYAQRLAAAATGRITLLWVLHPPPPSAAGDPLREVTPRREAEAYLRGLTEPLGPVPVEAVVVEGDPAPEILAAAAQRGSELIVMATHGRSGIGRWIYGSVADAVMRHAGVPVLLVPVTAATRSWPTGRAPRVLVPLDFSALSEAALPRAEDLARALGAELVLLSVTPLVFTADLYGGVTLAYDVDADQAERRRYLEAAAARLRAAGHTVRVRDTVGFPAGATVDVAREEDVDLIAMSTHGSGGATRLLMGSIATGVVQRAPVPVLIVRPEAVRQPEAPPAPSASAGPTKQT